MRKLLLGTTALVSLVAGVASAHPLQVMLGGTIDSQFGYVDQEDAYDIVGGSISGGVPTQTFGTNAYRTHKGNFANKSDVYVSVSHKADNGMVYGGFAGLQGKAQYDDKAPPKSKRTYLWMENRLGRFEFGSNHGVDATMKTDASSIARATGGVNGHWFWFANVDTGMTTSILPKTGNDPMVNMVTAPANHFYLTPNFITTAANEVNGESSRKISYYTPRWNGLQFGASYITDAGQLGNTNKAAKVPVSDNTLCCQGLAYTVVGTHEYQAKNVITLAANYRGKIDFLDVRASVLGNMGRSEKNAQNTQAFRHLREFQLGGSVHFAGFSVAASYQDSSKSLLAKSTQYDNTAVWTAGGSYVNGPVGVSLTYLSSQFNKNKFTNLSFGGDYQLARGLMPYVEVSFFNMKPSGANAPTTSQNSGSVFILGSELTF